MTVTIKIIIQRYIKQDLALTLQFVSTAGI